MATRILVIGSHGYVGSALAAFLRSNELSVDAVDSAPTPGDFDARPCQSLAQAELNTYDVVILLAGHSSVAACEKEPAAAFANNVGTFVELVHKLDGQPLIYASTSSVYVDTGGRAARETDPLPPPACYYDMHKQIIEQYAARAYHPSYGLRFGTVSGASPCMRTDVLLNSLVWSALTEGQIRVANRHKHRPLLGIPDLCRAIQRILSGELEPGSYNLASLNTRIGDVADYVANRFQVPTCEVHQSTKYDLQIDTTKFRAASGMTFEDTIPSLVDGLVERFASMHKRGSSSDV